MTYISKEDAIRLITDYQGGAMDKVTARKILTEMEEGIVRCMDCEFWFNKHLCMIHSLYGTIETKAYDFCSCGERIEE